MLNSLRTPLKNLTPGTTAEVIGGLFAQAKRVTIAEGRLLPLVMCKRQNRKHANTQTENGKQKEAHGLDARNCAWTKEWEIAKAR
ncbi:hypothetical protein [Shewanella algae]|uniref:hypothetical protein n=1 Tax=Shewanella algae TaxID=38313 RepID=UPI0031F5C871